jgi:hypothetical protein
MSASLLTHVMVVMEGQSVRASGRRVALAQPHMFLPPARYPRPGLHGGPRVAATHPLIAPLTYLQRAFYYYHGTGLRREPTPAQARRWNHKLNRHGK